MSSCKRVDELEVGDILIPQHMGMNKRSWKVIGIEPMGGRFFIKAEILGNDHPSIATCYDDMNYGIGEVVQIDTSSYSNFWVEQSLL